MLLRYIDHGMPSVSSLLACAANDGYCSSPGNSLLHPLIPAFFRIGSYSTFRVLVFPKNLPLAHCQCNELSWTCFVSCGVPLTGYKTVCLYTESHDHCEIMGVHLALA